jgi:hypothetical protein
MPVVEKNLRPDLVWRCGVCGYQRWAAEMPGACPACTAHLMTGMTRRCSTATGACRPPPGPDTLRAALRAAAAGGDGELLLLAADRDAVVAAVDLRVVTAEDRYLYARIRPKS